MMVDFQDGEGPVAAHKHSNGGGWVADTARVYGNALVYGNARVDGDALVYGNARVYDTARVYGNARVYGIMRSDGYCFVYVPCADGKKRVIVGCRYFTMPEALRHWKKTRGGTALGRETMKILAALKFLY